MRLAGRDAFENVPIRHERDALAPGPVARGEVRLDVVVVRQVVADPCQQFIRGGFRLFDTSAGELSLEVEDLPANDP